MTNHLKKFIAATALGLALLGSAQASEARPCDRSCQAQMLKDTPRHRWDRCMRQWAQRPQGVTRGEASVECTEQTGWDPNARLTLRVIAH